MKATALLMNEHKYILRALSVIEQMALTVENGSTLVDGDVKDILGFLRLFADHHHQGKEETILFPAMLQATHHQAYESVRWMIFEHNEERSLVEGLEDALRTKKGKDFARNAQRLVQILRTHIYKEDHSLFEHAETFFTPREDERIADELAAYDGPCKDSVLTSLLKRLDVLERKYLGKAA